MKNQNNGDKHNGNGHRKNVKYVTLKVRDDVLEKLRVNSLNANLSYSDYINQLIERNIYDKIFDDPQNRDALTNIMRHFAQKAREIRIQETGGFTFD